MSDELLQEFFSPLEEMRAPTCHEEWLLRRAAELLEREAKVVSMEETAGARAKGRGRGRRPRHGGRDGELGTLPPAS